MLGFWTLGSEDGIPETSGSRSDLLRVKRKIDDGVSNADLWEEEHPLMLRFHRSWREYKRVKSCPAHFEKEIITLIGATGTGKTRLAYDWYPDLYPVPSAKSSGTYFDDYDDHDHVLIDEIYGNRFTHGHLLRILDRYPLSVPVHGGSVNWRPHTIVLTSNASPDDWYDQSKFPYAGGPLERRLTTGRSRVYAVVNDRELRLDAGVEPPLFGPPNQ